jgi:signal transduction histidine kinase
MILMGWRDRGSASMMPDRMSSLEASTPFLRQSRAERLIAVGRVVLSVFSLLAVWLDPTEPSRYAATAYSLLVVYVGYSLVIAVVAFRSQALLLGMRLPTHAVDLGVAGLVMFFTEGPTSPFFVYFVFAMVSAAERWGWRGTLWTAIVALAILFGLGYYFGQVVRDPAFELNRFIIRGVYLGVVAVLLGSLGGFGERLRREISALAQWPRDTPTDGRELTRAILERIAGILGSSRLLMVWEEEEEPWLYLAFWTPAGCEWTREPAGSFEPLVAEPLTEASFFSGNAGAASPHVLFISGGRLRRSREQPVHPGLQARFDIGPVLSWRLRGQSIQGRLFALGEPTRSLDQLIVGEVLAWQAAAHLDRFQLLRRLREAAALEERVRLARDLHDGIIQSLTVATLRLQAFPRLLETDPGGARKEVQRLQELLASEQRELRSLVRELKPSGDPRLRVEAGLAAGLDEVRERIERNWSLRMELEGNFREATLQESASRQVHRLIHEAVINAARHAEASTVRVGLWVEEDQARIEVADDGRGFPFEGEYDLHALAASGMGPASLRDRIAALGGSLHLHSSRDGSRLEMTVPLQEDRSR